MTSFLKFWNWIPYFGEFDKLPTGTDENLNIGYQQDYYFKHRYKQTEESLPYNKFRFFCLFYVFASRVRDQYY